MAQAIAFTLHFYPAYTFDSLLDIYASQFYLLLEQGQRIKAATMLEQMQVAAYPHLDKEGQTKLLDAVESASHDMLDLEDEEKNLDSLKEILGG